MPRDLRLRDQDGIPLLIAEGLAKAGALLWDADEPLDAAITRSITTATARFPRLTESGIRVHAGDLDDCGHPLSELGFFLQTQASSDEANPIFRDPRGHITELERARPTLGAHCLELLSVGLARTLNAWSPSWAMSFAQMYHWRGESNEDAARAMIAEEEDMKPEDVNFEFTLQYWHDEVPEWVLKYPRTPPSLPDGLDPAKAEAIQRLRDWEHRTGILSREEYSSGYDVTESHSDSAAVIFWKPFGIVGNLIDEQLNHEVQGNGVTSLIIGAIAEHPRLRAEHEAMADAWPHRRASRSPRPSAAKAWLNFIKLLELAEEGLELLDLFSLPVDRDYDLARDPNRPRPLTPRRHRPGKPLAAIFA